MKPLIALAAALALSACAVGGTVRTAPSQNDHDGPAARDTPRVTVETFTLGGNAMTYTNDGVTQSTSFDEPLRAR